MADLIPFPRLMIDPTKRFDPQAVADLVMGNYKPFVPHPCANGMPGHPPCREPAELEAMLRASADTTANREES